MIGVDANPAMVDAAREAAAQHMMRGKVQWRPGDALLDATLDEDPQGSSRHRG